MKVAVFTDVDVAVGVSVSVGVAVAVGRRVRVGVADGSGARMLPKPQLLLSTPKISSVLTTINERAETMQTTSKSEGDYSMWEMKYRKG